MKTFHTDHPSGHKIDLHNPLHHGFNQYDENTMKTGSIMKMKSPEKYQSPPDPQQHKKNQKKMVFIEPGTPCGPFQQILSTTVASQSGVTTFLIAKVLTGPALHYASQVCNTKQQSKKPVKQLPEIPKGISGELGPHLYSYATITHQGMYRKSNEDKLTIYLEQHQKWFSIYDGHGGTACSQFLKQHLHEYFFKLSWKNDIPNALRKTFINAEQEWKKKGDNSGSCALVIFIYQNICYVANLGDSRAVLVSEGGSKCYQITKDHKPSNVDEQRRITEAGGKIYQTTAITEVDNRYEMIVGPLRVLPGRLSITRTFGDFEAKDRTKQGNDKVIICQPEITSFEIDSHDLIIMGSDGLWDRIDNVQLVQIIQGLKEQGLVGEQLLRKSSESMLEQAMKRGSSDNISIVLVGLTDPQVGKSPRKGNQHIKIMGSINGSRNPQLNKENSYPEKLRDLDLRILQINRNANRLIQSRYQ